MLNEIIRELIKKGFVARGEKEIVDDTIKYYVIIKDNYSDTKICVNRFMTSNAKVVDIVDNIIEEYSGGIKTSIPDFMSWNFAKDHLMLCVQPKSDEYIVKKNFLDLEAYVRVTIDKEKSYKVRPGMFPISSDELFDLAFNKTYHEIRYNLLSNVLGNEGYIVEEIPVFVASTDSKLFGGVAICYDHIFKEISEKYHSNLVIIPSSIHEVLIQVDNNPDINACNLMVNEVNKQECASSVVLSDHVYIYDWKQKKIL